MFKKRFIQIILFALCCFMCFSMIGVGCASNEGSANRYSTVEVENSGYTVSIKFDLATAIIKDGKSDYFILIPAQANSAEQYAAEELSSYLQKIAGASIQIFTEELYSDTKPSMKIISVGNTALKAKTLDYSGTNFNTDGFVIKTVEKSLFLFGGASQRGTLYAVYDYLENCCGCRFYLPEVEKIPTAKNVYLPQMDLVDIPTFALREVVYNSIYNGEFATKARLMTERGFVGGANGGKYGEIRSDTIWGSCHNIANVIIPKIDYGTSHPEWYYESYPGLYSFIYSYGVKEDGTYDDAMDLNPIDIAVESLKKAILSSDAFYFNISQEDGSEPMGNAVYTARAQRLRHSGVQIQFLNLVCDKLNTWIETALDDNNNKLFPNGRDYRLLSFAYGWSQTPPIGSDGQPLVKACQNILIWLAPIEFNMLYTYNDTQSQLGYVPGLFTGWEKCVEDFAIWDYYANFCSGACMYYSPFLSTAGANYRYYADLGIVNFVFSEIGGDSSWPRNEFDEIKVYCASKLMWNPYRYDIQSIIEEYCHYVFGDEGDAVLKVISNNEDNLALLANSGKSYYINHSLLNWAQFFPCSLIEKNVSILDEAIDRNSMSDIGVAAKQRIDLRLKKFKLCIMTNLLFEYNSYYPLADKNTKKEFTDNYFALLEETHWNDYFGKWNNFFYDDLYELKVN